VVYVCVCSAPSPVLQFVEDPDMHNAPETSLTASATPAAVTVQSKALQTEEIEIPQVTYLQSVSSHSNTALQKYT